MTILKRTIRDIIIGHDRFIPSTVEFKSSMLRGLTALLAMGVPALEAAAGGAWVHARAGAKMAPLGLVAGDLIAAIPPVLNDLAP